MEKVLNRMLYSGLGLLMGGVVLTRFTFVVDGGERAVIFNQIKGVQNRVYGEGMHFRIPLLMVSPRRKIINTITKSIAVSNPLIIATKSLRGSFSPSDHSLFYWYPRSAERGPLLENPVPPRRREAG